MKKTVFNFRKKTLLLWAMCFSAYAIQAQNFQWARSIGGASSDISRGITVDAGGNVITTGVFQGTIDIDPGPSTFTLAASGVQDVYVAKFNSSGNFIWGKSFGGASAYTMPYGIKVNTSGNIIITGEFTGTTDFDPSSTTSFTLGSGTNPDAFIINLDANGNFVWVKRIGSFNPDRGQAIALDANNNIYTTGYFSNTVDFDPGAGTFTLTSPGSGKFDVFVSKLDASGNFIWAKNMGGSFNDMGSAIAVDANNNVYTTGSFSNTADFDPGASVVSFTAAASTDMFISKLDPLGNFVWAKQFTCQTGKGIAVDNNFNVYTTSAFAATVDFDPGPGTYTLVTGVTGDADIFVSKLDVSGNFVWAKQLGGTNTGADDGLAITLDANNNVYTTGFFSGTGDFDPGPSNYTLTVAGGNTSNSDIFVSKLDASGNFVWAVQMGGTSSTDQGTSIAVDALGYVYTTGVYVGSGDFDQTAGTYTLSAAGITDCFVHKMGTNINTNVDESTITESLLLYPNPNNGIFNLSTKYFGTYTIHNPLGQLVKTIEVGEENTTIDVSELSSGIYYLSNKILIRKISISK